VYGISCLWIHNVKDARVIVWICNGHQTNKIGQSESNKHRKKTRNQNAAPRRRTTQHPRT